jgi:hypothetical protein
MIDLRGRYNLVWDSVLQPSAKARERKSRSIRGGSGTRFGSARSVPVLPSNGFIATGRTHRSATLTSIAFRLERWTTPRLLAEVVRPDSADETNLAHDYELYRHRDREPALTMRGIGTWNIPTVIIEAPHGAIRFTGPDARRFFLIEGHQRMRCLAAFHRYAECASEHETFILSYPDMA